MSQKNKYNKELLDFYIKRDNAILIGEYNELSSKTNIQFKCSCGCNQILTKLFQTIVLRNSPLKCLKNYKKEYPKNRKSNCIELLEKNKKMLDIIIERDNAILIGEYDKLIDTTIIQYLCICGSKDICIKRLREFTKNNSIMKCKDCISKIKFEKIKNTCLKKYNTEYVLRNKDIYNKLKETLIKKYGVEHISKIDGIKEKKIKTNIERYGVSVASKLEITKNKVKDTLKYKYNTDAAIKINGVKDKMKKTMITKYGVDNTFRNGYLRNKIKDTLIKKYGVDNVLRLQEFRNKAKETLLKKYGVEHPSQSLEIQEKSQKTAKSFYDYKMPSGDIRKIQGYEKFAIDELILIYNEIDIKTSRKDVPHIRYILDNKKHIYYPDIYIPKENKIIEVKSIWTYTQYNKTIKAKENATKLEGYNYEIWCYDAKRNKTVY